ncbi:MAG: GNAT family N-acetyltransferase [Flavisolibacter sp.]
MQLRSATPEDRPAIVELLRKSLGESSIPKSELLWQWKHEKNPFGPSHILLAEEKNTLLGLRAFLQWEWSWKGKIYKSIRAVDTATHPDHQGKGIFKKLTLQQIELSKQRGVSFVFNTPNDQSKPGYLKMGWIELGKLPLKLKLLRPLSLAYSRIFKEKSSKVENQQPSHDNWAPAILNLVNDLSGKSDQLSTRLSPEYISWRYEKNPLFNYNYFTDSKTFLIISRIKSHSFAQELRIVEIILLNSLADHKKTNAEIRKQVLQFCKSNTIDFISISGLEYLLHKDCLKWMGLIPIRALGPDITLRDLNMNDKFPELLNMNNWAYSLGDLELF